MARSSIKYLSLICSALIPLYSEAQTLPNLPAASVPVAGTAPVGCWQTTPTPQTYQCNPNNIVGSVFNLPGINPTTNIPNTFGTNGFGMVNGTFAITSSSTAATPWDTFQVYNTSNWTGGPHPGQNITAGRFYMIAPSGRLTYSWTLGTSLDNFNTAADATQNASLAAYCNQFSTGIIICSNPRIEDQSGNINPTVSQVTQEVDHYGTGPDTNNARANQDVHIGQHIVAKFTGTISGTNLTVSGVTGTIAANQPLFGIGVLAGTIISSGGGSSWVVNNSQSIGPINMITGPVGGSVYTETAGIIAHTDLGSQYTDFINCGLAAILIGCLEMADTQGIDFGRNVGFRTLSHISSAWIFQNGSTNKHAFIINDNQTIQFPVLTFATLPTCNAGAQGSEAYISDINGAASYGANVTTGGGTTQSTVVCNGTNWTQH